MRRHALAALGIVAALSTGCSRGEPGAYVPGLGEIMTATQMRHAKLWLAGRAGNWDLATYEIHELEEGFHDVVEFHPTHRNTDLPLRDLVPLKVDEPLRELSRAVDAHDEDAFTRAFDSLTAACNSCHQATSFGFNVVTRPTGNPFVNQDFAAPGG